MVRMLFERKLTSFTSEKAAFSSSFLKERQFPRNMTWLLGFDLRAYSCATD